MAATGVIERERPRRAISNVVLWRIGVLVGIWLTWETASASGLLYEGIAPSSLLVTKSLIAQLSQASFYWHLSITLTEIVASVAVGGLAGAAVGLLLGGYRLAGAAYEPLVHYLGPVPKIILLPVLVLMFGVGLGPKIAMGAISCFFPVCLSIASGMRQVGKVHINVARSFSATPFQMLRLVYIPSLMAPAITGLRLGIGLATIGVLLAETKVAKQGVGFLVIQSYNLFHIADMYALLILIFAMSICINLWLGTVEGRHAGGR